MLFGHHQSLSCLLRIGIIAQNYKLILPKNSIVPIFCRFVDYVMLYQISVLTQQKPERVSCDLINSL